VWSLEVLNIDDVINSLASMGSDVLGLWVEQLLFWLDLEVLTLNPFLKFLSHPMSSLWLLMAVSHLFWVIWHLSCFLTS
jgi:hypothetical protein